MRERALHRLRSIKIASAVLVWEFRSLAPALKAGVWDSFSMSCGIDENPRHDLDFAHHACLSFRADAAARFALYLSHRTILTTSHDV